MMPEPGVAQDIMGAGSTLTSNGLLLAEASK
jgi:hypothetical protein